MLEVNILFTYLQLSACDMHNGSENSNVWRSNCHMDFQQKQTSREEKKILTVSAHWGIFLELKSAMKKVFF